MSHDTRCHFCGGIIVCDGLGVRCSRCGKPAGLNRNNAEKLVTLGDEIDALRAERDKLKEDCEFHENKSLSYQRMAEAGQAAVKRQQSEIKRLRGHLKTIKDNLDSATCQLVEGVEFEPAVKIAWRVANGELKQAHKEASEALEGGGE